MKSRVLTLCVVILVCFEPASAQSSPYVPNLDPAYSDLDALVAVGLVEVPSMAQRPYSRMAFARFVTEARAKWGDSGLDPARFIEALSRLEERFSDEVLAVCQGGEEICRPVQPQLRLTQASVDVASASSPRRPIRTPHSTSSRVDGDINPLLQGNQGRILADGQTIGVETTLNAQLGPRFAAQLRPRAWAGRGDEVELEGITLLDGYLRGMLGGFAIEAGRINISRGHAREGGALLSHNARGLDLVRVMRERPLRLPWIFGAIGSITGSAWLADMGPDRTFPHSKLIGLELGVRPARALEFGVMLLNHQGGEGAPAATLRERFRDLFPPVGPIAISDRVVVGDMRVTLTGLDLYGSVLTTDADFTPVGWRLRESWWVEAVWTVGARRVGLGSGGRMDAWIEARRAGTRTHTHHQFLKGMTIDRRLIGDPLGPLATALQAGLDWTGSVDVVRLSGAWELYSGDDWEELPHPRHYTRISDNPDEIRLRATLDWSRDLEGTDFRTTVRLGYEHVTRFNFTDENRSNYLAQVKLAWIPN